MNVYVNNSCKFNVFKINYELYYMEKNVIDKDRLNKSLY